MWGRGASKVAVKPLASGSVSTVAFKFKLIVSFSYLFKSDAQLGIVGKIWNLKQLNRFSVVLVEFRYVFLPLKQNLKRLENQEIREDQGEQVERRGRLHSHVIFNEWMAALNVLVLLGRL